MPSDTRPKPVHHRWYSAAGFVFVLGFVGCWLIQDVLGPSLGNMDLFGFIVYFCGPLPAVPAVLLAVGVFCQIADWWRERKRVQP
jgi:hypothetical protein